MQRTFSARHRQSRFDIVEGHEHLGINTVINMFHRNTVSTITRYHTAYHSLVRRGLVDWPKSLIVNKLEKHSLSSADHRISASKFIDEITQEDFAGIPPADAIIPLNITLCPARAAVNKEPLIVFVGRMVAGHKNPDMAARAFATLADRFSSWRIEFAGPDMPLGNGETMWQKCEKVLAPYQGRYKYHGVLSREQVNELYTRASISLIPSKFESFGLVALEAMAAGCVPVVASETALPEVVGEAGVIFNNGSMEDLISQLSCLMRDEHVLQNRSTAGVRRVHDVYSDSSIMKLNLDFYQSAIRS
jgi:glycosyltransferase involved in cell wall biosynthesis